MKKYRVLGVFSLLLLNLNLWAFKVNEGELKNAEIKDAVFVNYTGPHLKIDSLSGIKKIGTDLGAAVAADPEKPSKSGSPNRYFVIHAVDPAEKGKFDADIISIGKAAAVDHITNVRRIIAAYLTSAYGYSEKDAETLAVFITVYNAVYRGKLNSPEKYKKIVIENLSQNSSGLSLNYKEWAGNTQIVIPLYDVNGGLSTVDTSIISSDEIVKNMQAEDDKGISPRKGMVDLKEREADLASLKAQNAQKKAAEEQKKLAEEKQKTAKLQQEAADADRLAFEAEKKAEENPEDEEAKKDAEAKRIAAAQKHDELSKQQETENAQLIETNSARDEAAEKQATADKKLSESQAERKEIAKDQQEIIERDAAMSKLPFVFGIELTDGSGELCSLVKINSDTGKIIKISKGSYIRNRTIFKTGDNFIAIAGETGGNKAVKLVIFSSDTMEINSESNEIVSEKSVLIQDEGLFYCIIQENEKWLLARYDQNLSLKNKSNISVKMNTPVTVTENHIIVTDYSGTVRLLKKADLLEIF